ncbi:MAG: S8 family serine peptidase, partial [Bacilli bacterium]|nr:S8 family serine peptidase [Bacilli bacterium]
PLYQASNSFIGQWAHTRIESESAWDFTTGIYDVRVGVIDTGIENHIDLNLNVATGFDFTNIVDGDPDILKNDVVGHGTHIAGIIGSVGNQSPSIGTVGVNWKVTMIPLQVAESNGQISSTACVEAINYARELWNTDDRISILNMSIGGYNEWPEIESAIRQYQGLFVCSTGNNGQDIDQTGQHHYPSFYASNLYENPIPNMIAVGRIDINDERPTNANWGENTISIYAPGEIILSTFPQAICDDFDDLFYDGTILCEFSKENRDTLQQYVNSGEFTWNNILNNFNIFFGNNPSIFISTPHHSDGYHFMSGSSMATPFVTGVAALLLSINSNLTALQLKSAILASADTISIQVPTGDNGALQSQDVIRLNAYGAVKYVLTNYVATSYNLSSSMSTQNISKTVLSNNDYFINDNGFYKLNVSSSTQYDFNVSSSYPIDVILYDSDYNQLTYTDLNNSSSITKFTKTLSSGTYYLRVKYQSNTQAGTIYTSINCHSYTDHYVWKNLTEHKSYCACGEYTTSFHIVSPDAFQSGLLTAPCLLCNGPASFGGIIHDGIGNYPYTLNGSFVLPNGIIVLEEADMEAYLNGTLIFINPNENIDRSEAFIPREHNKK